MTEKQIIKKIAKSSSDIKEGDVAYTIKMFKVLVKEELLNGGGMILSGLGHLFCRKYKGGNFYNIKTKQVEFKEDFLKPYFKTEKELEMKVKQIKLKK